MHTCKTCRDAFAKIVPDFHRLAASGVTETLRAPRNLVRWGLYAGASLCRDFLLVGGFLVLELR